MSERLRRSAVVSLVGFSLTLTACSSPPRRGVYESREQCLARHPELPVDDASACATAGSRYPAGYVFGPVYRRSGWLFGGRGVPSGAIGEADRAGNPKANFTSDPATGAVTPKASTGGGSTARSGFGGTAVDSSGS
ncbi:MAG: hypothetical protein ACKVWR_20960 [Acidimicrobiales bacterium]